MDDDKKKPGRAGKPGGAGAGRPRGGPAKAGFGKGPGKGGPVKGGPRQEGRKPFAKSAPRPGGGKAADGERKPFVKREYGDRPARAASAVEGGDRKPFVKREYGDRPARAEGDRKPFVKREYGDRPARAASAVEGGDRKPFVKREYGDRPARAEGDRKPFVKREYGDRPARAASAVEGGDRKPFVKREYGDRPARADSAGEGGERKPFVKREFGDRPARPADAAGEGGRKLEKYWGKRPGKFERQAAGEPGEKTSSAPEGERRPRKSFDGPRPERGDGAQRGDRPARSFGDKPAFRGDREGRPARPFGDRPGGKPFQDRKSAPRREAEAAEPEAGERIAKRLARAGISSRRDAEELIAAGRVKVNGKILESPAFNVMHNDRIELDGTEIPAIERTRLFLFHKPAGIVTTNRDPEGRRTVFDILPEGLPRLMTIGRLDINTEGLLLLTNDGGLSRVLELPATGWLRRYRVRVHGKVDEPALAGLKDGIAVDGVFYGSVEASLEREQGSNAWLTIGLREGKNREVKNILGALGLEVNRLIRVSYGPFQLGELPEGHVMEIKGRMLRDQLGERLVEELGANFDAEITKPFSNQPVRRGFEKPARVEDHAPARKPRQIGYEKPGGLIKNFRRDRDDKRDDKRESVLGRLTTSRPDRQRFEGGPDGFKRGDGDGRGGRFAKPVRDGKPGFDKKPGGGKREREERPIVEPGVRKANVWMAPGSRPIGSGRAESEKAAHAARKAEKSGHRGGPAKGGGKPGFAGKRDGDRPSGPPRGNGPRGSGPRGPRKG